MRYSVKLRNSNGLYIGSVFDIIMIKLSPYQNKFEETKKYWLIDSKDNLALIVNATNLEPEKQAYGSDYVLDLP